MKTRSLLSPWLVFAFPIAIIMALVGTKIFAPDLYEYHVVREDSLTEWLQFVFFALAAVPALLTSRQLLTARLRLLGMLYGGLALMLFFVAGEEISWGQRLFDLESPSFFQTNNLQGEITLHNLGYGQAHEHIFMILLGLYGALAWLPVAWLDLRRFRLIDGVVPAWYLSPYFIFVALLNTLIAYVAPRVAAAFDIEWLEVSLTVHGGALTWRDQEPGELLLSLGFLLFALDGYRKARGHWVGPPKEVAETSG